MNPTFTSALAVVLKTFIKTVGEVKGLSLLALDGNVRICGAEEFLGDWQKSLLKAERIRCDGM